MLEINVAGTMLNLPSDISFDLVIENPFMIADRIPTPFSLTFALPNTRENLARFNFPNRLASTANYETIQDVTIYVDGLAITTGTLKLDTYDNGVINAYYLGAAYIPNSGSMMYNVDMEKYNLNYCNTKDEVITETGFYPSYKALLSSTLPGTQKFVCPPVRIKNDQQFTPLASGPLLPEFLDETKVYTYFLRHIAGYDPKRMAQIAYLNYWNVGLSAWRYRDEHMPNISFPFVGYIFESAFKSYISNNVFKNGELAKLVMINQFNPKALFFPSLASFYGCVFDNGLGGNTPYFKINSYCPGFEIGKFLKELLKIFCISVFTKKEGGFEMAFNKDILNSIESDDWSSLVAGDIVCSQRKMQTYTWGYNNVLEEVDNNPIVYQATAHKNMYNIPMSAIPTVCQVLPTKEVYNITQAEITESMKLLPNQNILIPGRYYKAVDDRIKYNGNEWKPVDTVFQCYSGQLSFAADAGRVIDITSDLWQFECINQGLGGSSDTSEEITSDDTTSDGEYSVKADVSPLPMSVEKYWKGDIAPVFGEWLVPVVEEPRYIRPKTAHIGLYHGARTANNGIDQYPYVSSHNYDINGARIGALTLSWDGDDGLLKMYHTEFKAWIEKNKKAVTANMKLDALALKNIDLKKKKNIQGVNFFIEKISVSIKRDRIELAQVDLLEC